MRDDSQTSGGVVSSADSVLVGAQGAIASETGSSVGAVGGIEPSDCPETVGVLGGVVREASGAVLGRVGPVSTGSAEGEVSDSDVEDAVGDGGAVVGLAGSVAFVEGLVGVAPLASVGPVSDEAPGGGVGGSAGSVEAEGGLIALGAGVVEVAGDAVLAAGEGCLGEESQCDSDDECSHGVFVVLPFWIEIYICLRSRYL